MIRTQTMLTALALWAVSFVLALVLLRGIIAFYDSIFGDDDNDDNDGPLGTTGGA